jgi:hypothetical protein
VLLPFDSSYKKRKGMKGKRKERNGVKEGGCDRSNYR